MLIVTIQITREGTTSEQKASLIKGATNLLEDVLNKPPGLTFVVIEEVELENWGVNGLPAAEHRRIAAEPVNRSVEGITPAPSRPGGG